MGLLKKISRRWKLWSTGGKPVPLEGHPSIDLEKFFNESQIYLELKFLFRYFLYLISIKVAQKKINFFV